MVLVLLNNCCRFTNSSVAAVLEKSLSFPEKSAEGLPVPSSAASPARLWATAGVVSSCAMYGADIVRCNTRNKFSDLQPQGPRSSSNGSAAWFSKFSRTTTTCVARYCRLCFSRGQVKRWFSFSCALGPVKMTTYARRFAALRCPSCVTQINAQIVSFCMERFRIAFTVGLVYSNVQQKIVRNRIKYTQKGGNGKKNTGKVIRQHWPP